MPSTRNPAAMTADERQRELARLLATGLVRLGSSLLALEPAASSAPENSSESSANQLAEAGQKSVTVTGG